MRALSDILKAQNPGQKYLNFINIETKIMEILLIYPEILLTNWTNSTKDYIDPIHQYPKGL